MIVKGIKRIALWVVFLPLLILSIIFLVAYLKQDAIVQSQIDSLNKSYTGKISVGDVHVAPFANYPYMSIKVDDVTIYESKMSDAPVILNVKDIYLGFSIWDIIVGDYDIQSLIIEDGFFDFVLHTDGKTNIENALALSSENQDDEPIAIHLQKITLKNLDLHKREEASNLDIETYIYRAQGGFKTKNNQIAAHIDSEFLLNVMKNGDTTYLKQKHFEFNTDIVYDEVTGIVNIEPSGITMEHGDFEIKGTIDTKQDMTLDIAITGSKPNFDLFIAFAPAAVIPILERYKSSGDIYLNATLEGPTSFGRQPFINAKFGASKAYLENSLAKKRINQMDFSGHFTNGKNRDFTTMEFMLQDLSANLEKGTFKGAVSVKNFETPDIEMNLDADFNIDFIVSFLNLTEIENASGNVDMKLKFHDIIDLEFPEKALNDLNQAYFAEVKIKDLSFNSKEFISPLQNLDAHLVMNGKKAVLDEFNMVMGNSNISITGTLSDLPAIVHHTKAPVTAHLEIKSDLIDIAQLTNYSKKDSTGIDERIQNLSLGFSFNTLGNAFSEYKQLPKGEFFIDQLYADLKHYPHTLHDFHADIVVDDTDIKVVDFIGQIDDSDFHLDGNIHDYSFWMQNELNGNVSIDVNLASKLLRLEDLFTYEGENYVPADYQHEEIENLETHIVSNMFYKKNMLQSIDVQLDKLDGKMHIHPLKMEEFSGRFHYEKEQLTIDQFHGKIGKSVVDLTMNYYLGEDKSLKKKDNILQLSSTYLDFDSLTNFSLKAPDSGAKEQKIDTKTTEDMASHAEAFNLYELPFTDMKFEVDVAHFMYHRLDLKNIKGTLRTTEDHYIYVDTLSLNAAGGHMAMNGYFNGNDSKHIYLKPNISLSNIDLDKLLFKFENFGQDAIVSENLHGQLNADITGNIRVYPDMVTDLDQSEVHLDAQVINGRLENYDPVMMLSSYFDDSELTNIKFDTLQNHMDITNGKISIPNMTIESSLGHMDISGTQDMNDNIDYFLRIPWKLVKRAARNKLFGVKKNDSISEEIIEVDPKKKIKYLNLNISGSLDAYKIRMKKAEK